MTASELEIVLRRLEGITRRVVREELAAHEARRAAGEATATEGDDVAQVARDLAARARKARRSTP